MPSGVRCPFCCSQEQKVIDSRPTENGWKRRRRECQCGKRFTTLEVILPDTAEGRSKLAVGINLITYAMSMLREHEAQYFAYGLENKHNKINKKGPTRED